MSARSGTPKDGPYTVALSQVKREAVDWLWAGRIPLGMLTLLVGDPGVGKSLLTILLGAEVSRAGDHVLLLSAEDHAAATIRPRAEAAGADLDRLHVVGVRRDGLEDGIVLPDDAKDLGRLVAEHNARLVVVDPLSAHLSDSVNSWRDQSVRRALTPLHRLAEDCICAVVVVAHLNKGLGTDPLYRTGGSIGIPAAVRSALLLARDPEDPEGSRGPRRILAHHKSNVAELAESLSCRVETVGETARLQIVGSSNVQASELLARPDSPSRSKLEQATDFLSRMLEDGPRPTQVLKDAAIEAGIGWRTVEAAKAHLGIKAEKQKGRRDGIWVWVSPNSDEGRTAGYSDSAVFRERASSSGSGRHDATEDRKAAGAQADAASPKLIDATEAARRLGVSRDYIYRHGAELGVVRLGDGPRPRVRFDPDKVTEALGSFGRKPRPKRETVRPVRRGHGVTLLPIRGESP